MRITSKGQVTIPVEIRERAGLLPNTEVEFAFDGQTVRIFKVEGGTESRGRAIVRRLRGSGTANLDMSTDEILELMRGD
jgi:AbrB family looped-hinge helix DNA binding protein